MQAVIANTVFCSYAGTCKRSATRAAWRFTTITAATSAPASLPSPSDARLIPIASHCPRALSVTPSGAVTHRNIRHAPERRSSTRIGRRCGWCSRQVFAGARISALPVSARAGAPVLGRPPSGMSVARHEQRPSPTMNWRSLPPRPRRLFARFATPVTETPAPRQLPGSFGYSCKDTQCTGPSMAR